MKARDLIDDYWTERHVAHIDELNDDMWRRSPAEQRRIQSPAQLRPSPDEAHPLFYGAQQAMIERENAVGVDEDMVLPWVPDLVGSAWQDPSSLLIVGLAYAGFIAEYAGRFGAMPLAEYVRANNWREFQRDFLARVVQGDHNYYTPVARLAEVAGDASHVALFDLCRASFVRRGTWLAPNKLGGVQKRGDTSDSQSLGKGATWFTRYVEDHQPAEWTWQRIVHSQAASIVALGYAAEHGLLRLFASRGMTIRVNMGEPPSRPINPESDLHGRWIKYYADPTRKLDWWLDDQRWWAISGKVDGQDRAWRLLPVHHPASRANEAPKYQRSRDRLAAMMAATN